MDVCSSDASYSNYSGIKSYYSSGKMKRSSSAVSISGFLRRKKREMSLDSLRVQLKADPNAPAGGLPSAAGRSGRSSPTTGRQQMLGPDTSAQDCYVDIRRCRMPYLPLTRETSYRCFRVSEILVTPSEPPL